MHKTTYLYLPTIAISDYLYLIRASITYHFISTISIKMPNFTLNIMERTQP